MTQQIDLSVRCFSTIAGSFNGIRARVESEIACIETRNFNVEVYRNQLMAAVVATQPFAGMMVAGGQVAVDFEIVRSIEEAFRLLDEVDRNLSTANWFLDNLIGANLDFTRHSATKPRTLVSSEANEESTVIKGFIAFAADPANADNGLKQKSFDSLGKVKGLVEAADMRNAHDALNNGRRFATRCHMIQALVSRGRLVVVES